MQETWPTMLLFRVFSCKYHICSWPHSLSQEWPNVQNEWLSQISSSLTPFSSCCSWFTIPCNDHSRVICLLKARLSHSISSKSSLVMSLQRESLVKVLFWVSKVAFERVRYIEKCLFWSVEWSPFFRRKKRIENLANRLVVETRSLIITNPLSLNDGDSRVTVKWHLDVFSASQENCEEQIVTISWLTLHSCL